MEGKASLYPGRDGGFDVQVAMLPEHMAALEQDEELWAAVSPDAAPAGQGHERMKLFLAHNALSDVKNVV